MKQIYLTLSLILTTFTINTFAQNALHFDGTDDVVQTTFPGVLGDSNRTFEAWIKVDASAPTSNLTILDYGLNAVGSRNTFVVDNNRALRFTSGGTNANMATGNAVITAGQWTHVAFVLDNGTGYMYANGIQVGTGNLSTVNTPSGTNVRIGERVPGGSIRFQGIIDEVRIWNVALDTFQIRANMNKELCIIPTGLAAYYKFNEGTANGTNSTVTMTADEIGMAQGTLTGFALTGTTSNWVPGAPISTGGNTFDTLTVTDCKSYLSPSGKYTYTASGSYMDTITNVFGCDSIMTINLTLANNPTFANLTIDTCGAYTVPSGKKTFNTTTVQTYLDTIPNSQNCDSIIAINLTVTVISKGVNTSGNNRLTATEAGGSYQWLDCNNGFAIIPNETNRFLDPAVSGSYAAQITKNGCIDTTACVTVVGVGLEEATFKANFYISNNPAKDNFKLYNNNKMPVTTTIVSLNGTVVKAPQYSNAEIIDFDVTQLSTGIYILNVLGEDGSMAHYKLIKK